ncbi:MAG: TadE/TadG family type IV pilus assembly protein [Myxococcota bacterium]|nr:TadE/TadG family type IV pilus assembly protein [Myxococcota bacterium]
MITRRQGRRGNAGIEMALTLPVLLLLLGGIVDFGLYFSDAQKANHAVRQAARAAAGTDYDLAPQAIGEATLSEQLALFSLPTGTDTTRSVVVDSTTGLVTVTYHAPYEGLVGLVASSDNLKLGASMTLTMEDLHP